MLYVCFISRLAQLVTNLFIPYISLCAYIRIEHPLLHFKRICGELVGLEEAAIYLNEVYE